MSEKKEKYNDFARGKLDQLKTQLYKRVINGDVELLQVGWKSFIWDQQVKDEGESPSFIFVSRYVGFFL